MKRLIAKLKLSWFVNRKRETERVIAIVDSEKHESESKKRFEQFRRIEVNVASAGVELKFQLIKMLSDFWVFNERTTK